MLLHVTLARRPVGSLLMLSALVSVEGRHVNADLNIRLPGSTDDPTVNSRPAVQVDTEYDPQNIFVTQRTTTTQQISFSPDRWPISRSKMVGVWPEGSANFTRSISKLRVVQRACELSQGQSYHECYAAPFTIPPGPTDKTYLMYRKAGSAGIPAKEQQLFMINALGQETYQSIFIDRTLPFLDVVETSRFTFNPDAENTCNNHRGVTMDTAYPEILAALPQYEHYLSSFFYNDAEHAEEIIGVPPSSCQWVPEETNIIQEVTPLPGQVHPDNVPINAGAWDHNFEVCAFHGECTSDTFECINAFRVELLSTEVDVAEPKVQELFFIGSKNLPIHGAGDLQTLRSTKESGPHLPCPVGDDGRQLPCTVPIASPALPTGMQLLGTAESSGVPPGFVEPAPLMLHVNNIAIKKLAHIGPNSYTLKFKYKVTWSDRFAVHPCTIPLYSFGAGVPKSGKTVDASKWWTPVPDDDTVSSMSYTSKKNLTVCHEPGDDTGEDGCVKVTTPCRVQTCPWPKQLWLQDELTVVAKETASWDLFKYPFDKQILRIHLKVVDDDHYTDKSLMNKTFLIADLPADNAFDDDFDDMYPPDAWSVYHARVTNHPTDRLGLLVTLKISRNSISTIYKCVIPMIANAFLVILSCSMAPSARLKVMGLSLVVASSMLNPSFLGLPGDVQGVPYVQSLVIIHMLIAFLVLSYSLRDVAIDFYYDAKVRQEVKTYHASTTGVWKEQGVATWKKWVEYLGGSHPADVKVEVLNEKDGAAAVADSSKPAVTLETKQVDFQKGVVELLVALPALILRKDPTRPETIWTPWKEPQKQILPKYGAYLARRKVLDRYLVMTVPCLFAFAWFLDFLIYFAFVPEEPQ